METGAFALQKDPRIRWIAQNQRLMKRAVILLKLLLLFLLVCDSRAVGDAGAREQPVALAHRAYVWQRVWSPALCRSVEAHAGEFAALDVFAAEIGFQPNDTVVYAEPQWDSLHQSARAVALVIRIGSPRGRFTENSTETNKVVAVCRRTVENATKHGVAVAELQIDYDAATSRLKDYTQLLRVLRRELGSTRIVITALPTWLDSPVFRELVGIADGYVLQVHSLTKPTSFDQTGSLCASGQSIRWIHAAETIGRPFRVALPTYGYRAAFASSGSFVGLQAEGPARVWPVGTRLRELWAEPAEVVRIVNTTVLERPAHCEGLSWFRLPSDEDELAWRWPTLCEVMQGRIPIAKLQVTAERNRDGAYDLVLRNTGTGRGIAGAVRLRWSHAKLIASDMINGWQMSRENDGAVVLRPPGEGTSALLQPEETARIGWLRFDAEVEISTADNL